MLPTPPALATEGATQTLEYPPSGRGSVVGQGSGDPVSDRVLSLLVHASALTILLMIGSLVAVLTYAAIPSFKAFGPKFLISSSWQPNDIPIYKRDALGHLLDDSGQVTHDPEEAAIDHIMPARFGALPVIYGTAVSSALALLFAIPLSLGAALFLVRAAPEFLKGPIPFLIEFLAAIPSIAYGIWGLFIVVPFLQLHVEPGLNTIFAGVPGLGWLHNATTTGRDMFCGSLILGIMIVPIITAVSRDLLKAVPRVQIEGTLALGATWWQSCWEMLRYSRSGLFGAVMLGLARAAGETMAVTMVIGNALQIKGSPFAGAQTMSSLLANAFAEAGSPLERGALLEIALILLLMSLIFNVVARYLVVGKQSRGAAGH